MICPQSLRGVARGKIALELKRDVCALRRHSRKFESRGYSRIGDEKVPDAENLVTLPRALPGSSPYGGIAITRGIVNGVSVDGFLATCHLPEVFTG